MIIIGIAGGTGSGKTTVVNKIANQFSESEVAILSQDSYYKDNSHLTLEERRLLNFDHPDSIEFSLLNKHLEQLKKGMPIEEPEYSYLTCTRSEQTTTVQPKPVVIVEGILVLANSSLRKLMDIKVFVDCDSDLRLSRVIQRDIIERGRDVQSTLTRYEETVRPSHLQFIEPTKRFADIIVPEGGNNEVAIRILTNFIKQIL
ncbi:uridine kinase [Mangrovibacterium diazotrophicum]|uniref:Uridine kinase n=1 Tax=Mangrovibacterium diazotrophicum TaxID=1261403 RepID=A0A419VWE5_9BACT|nr:uridine kinase [Mangrovibacterium diazotrophicum]RKD86431.1 uridine kinase [Mangrovibacterium diazotrophicum]